MSQTYGEVANELLFKMKVELLLLLRTMRNQIKDVCLFHDKESMFEFMTRWSTNERNDMRNILLLSLDQTEKKSTCEENKKAIQVARKIAHETLKFTEINKANVALVMERVFIDMDKNTGSHVQILFDTDFVTHAVLVKKDNLKVGRVKITRFGSKWLIEPIGKNLV